MAAKIRIIAGILKYFIVSHIPGIADIYMCLMAVKINVNQQFNWTTKCVKFQQYGNIFSQENALTISKRDI